MYAYELAEKYVTAKKAGKPHPFVFKTYNGLSSEQQEQFREIAKTQGFPFDYDGPKTKKNKNRKASDKIYWTDEEWDRVASIVFQLRKKDPVVALSNLVQKAVQQLPKARQRVVQHGNMGRLIEAVKEKMDDQEKKALAHESFQKAAPPISKQDILSSLTEDEIFSRFSETIFQHLTIDDVLHIINVDELLDIIPIERMIGRIIRVYSEKFFNPERNMISLSLNGLQQAQVANGTISQRPTAKLDTRKKIAVFGLLPIQHQKLAEELGDKVKFNFVDKNRRTDLPTGQDLYVVSRFCNHAISETLKGKNEASKVIRHAGGINEMVELIKGYL